MRNTIEIITELERINDSMQCVCDEGYDYCKYCDATAVLLDIKTVLSRAEDVLDFWSRKGKKEKRWKDLN